MRKVVVRIRPKSRADIPDILNCFSLDAKSVLVSKLGAISLVLSPHQFTSIFQSAELIEARDKDEESITWLTTKERIKSPKEIQAKIDFLYIPRPPKLMRAKTAFKYPPVRAHHFTLDKLAPLFNADKVHAKSIHGQSIQVAMVDTGIDKKHPFFISQQYCINGHVDPILADPHIDVVGHGTGECANIFALAPGCEVISFNIHENRAEIALEKCCELNIPIVNCSWGHDLDGRSLQQLQNDDEDLYFQVLDLEQIIDSYKSRITFVFAAGNGHDAFPACLPDVISVGGIYIDSNQRRLPSTLSSRFLNYFYAPPKNIPCICGVIGDDVGGSESGHILLPVPDNCPEYDGLNLPKKLKGSGWGLYSGTSAAAPQLSGIFALFKMQSPEKSSRDVLTILQRDAQYKAKVDGVNFYFPDVFRAMEREKLI